ncbi:MULTISPECIES: hypothetical protein [Streptomyces]|uniref:hypothetical protein n=1 Tax=Streptomyces TaxID=1883 RepID=UPI00224D3A58|nr:MULTISPECIES: hypothetical protein [Streptomyces]MCX5059118.1 hypothetical protein [Streptomyces sp. NBC_00452]MCZ4506694.1 hypothetical protein [Streptomyces sp. ActVer]WSD90514.1 hypothetical protein OG925_42125 [Streptomyces canus]WSS99412.1 hypothetical protein OG478_51085 [Streptomyces phaeochromogenes]
MTDLIERSANVLEVASEINRLGLGVWLDGRSDYGNSIETFSRDHAGELRARTTVLVLGDTRSDYRAPTRSAGSPAAAGTCSGSTPSHGPPGTAATP